MSARFLSKERDSLLKRALGWREAIYSESQLPVWLRESLINILYLFPVNSLWGGRQTSDRTMVLSGRRSLRHDRWAVPCASRDLNEILTRPGLDAVIVATPPDSHLSIALAAIAKGKHLLVEKPLGPSVVESKQMVEAARKSKVGLFVGYEKRFHSTLRKVRSLLRNGAIGNPYYGGVHWASNRKAMKERRSETSAKRCFEKRSICSRRLRAGFSMTSTSTSSRAPGNLAYSRRLLMAKAA